MPDTLTLTREIRKTLSVRRGILRRHGLLCIWYAAVVRATESGEGDAYKGEVEICG